MDDPSAPTWIAAAKARLNEHMSACRFQVVVERCRRQVKTTVDGKRSSKWKDTDQFSVALFDGALVVLPTAEAEGLLYRLNEALTTTLSPFRSPAFKQAKEAVALPLTLAAAKRVQTLLSMVEQIDDVRYAIQQRSEATSAVFPHIPKAPLLVSGDDRTMNGLLTSLNKSLSDIMQDYVSATHLALRSAFP